MTHHQKGYSKRGDPMTKPQQQNHQDTTSHIGTQGFDFSKGGTYSNISQAPISKNHSRHGQPLIHVSRNALPSSGITRNTSPSSISSKIVLGNHYNKQGEAAHHKRSTHYLALISRKQMIGKLLKELNMSDSDNKMFHDDTQSKQ